MFFTSNPLKVSLLVPGTEQGCHVYCIDFIQLLDTTELLSKAWLNQPLRMLQKSLVTMRYIYDTRCNSENDREFFHINWLAGFLPSTKHLYIHPISPMSSYSQGLESFFSKLWYYWYFRNPSWSWTSWYGTCSHWQLVGFIDPWKFIWNLKNENLHCWVQNVNLFRVRDLK